MSMWLCVKNLTFIPAFDRYGILPNTKSTPNRIIIYPTTDGQVSLPWLDRSFLSDFRIKNGQLVDSTGSKGANLGFINKTQPIVIRPKDFYATPLIALALFAFMGVIYLVWRRKEENERAAHNHPMQLTGSPPPKTAEIDRSDSSISVIQ